jgi:hypothetical protein
MVGGVLALLLTPPFASAYVGWAGESPTPLINTLRSAVAPLLGFASVDVVYQTYGRLYLLAALLMFAGLVVLRPQVARHLGRLGDRGLVVLVVGLVGDYVIGETFGEVLHGLSFTVEGLGILVLLVGTLLVGIGGRRTADLPTPVALLLILALPLACIGTFLIGHLPSGPMVGVCAAWVGLGSSMRSGTTVARP